MTNTVENFFSEEEAQRPGNDKATIINHTYINSGEYRRKFDSITESPEMNRLLYQLAKKMLNHRSGYRQEDMYWIDPNTMKVVAAETDCQEESEIIYSQSTKDTVASTPMLITIHSHPSSFPPSAKDLNCNYSYQYALGIVVGHDGSVYVYRSNTIINEDYFELKVAKLLAMGYNMSEAHLKAVSELKENDGIDVIVKEVTV